MPKQKISTGLANIVHKTIITFPDVLRLLQVLLILLNISDNHSRRSENYSLYLYPKKKVLSLHRCRLLSGHILISAYSLNNYAICRTAMQVFLPHSHEQEAAQLLLQPLCYCNRAAAVVPHSYGSMSHICHVLWPVSPWNRLCSNSGSACTDLGLYQSHKVDIPHASSKCAISHVVTKICSNLWIE